MGMITVTPLLIVHIYDLRIAIKTMETITVLEMAVTNYPTTSAVNH